MSKRTKLSDRTLPTYSKGEEIFNMVSHIVGGALGIAALVLCVITAAKAGSVIGVVSSCIYGVTLITLSYHQEGAPFFRKLQPSRGIFKASGSRCSSWKRGTPAHLQAFGKCRADQSLRPS